MCNRPKCFLNVSEDEVGYQEDPPKRMPRCYGCQNGLTESSKQYQKKITVKKK